MIYTGIGLVVIGFAIRLYCMKCLKNKFSFELKMQTEIVKAGAYKYIRHPCYVGSIMVIAGLSLLYIPLAVTYLAFAFFLARAVNEEHILSTNPDYREYRKTTGMFLPRIKLWHNKDYQ